MVNPKGRLAGYGYFDYLVMQCGAGSEGAQGLSWGFGSEWEMSSGVVSDLSWVIAWTVEHLHSLQALMW